MKFSKEHAACMKDAGAALPGFLRIFLRSAPCGSPHGGSCHHGRVLVDRLGTPRVVEPQILLFRLTLGVLFLLKAAPAGTALVAALLIFVTTGLTWQHVSSLLFLIIKKCLNGPARKLRGSPFRHRKEAGRARPENHSIRHHGRLLSHGYYQFNSVLRSMSPHLCKDQVKF